MGFCVCLNNQGRYATHQVGDFIFVVEAGRHAWQGKIAATAEELAEYVNGAVKSIVDFGDPFKTLEVVECRMPNAERRMEEPDKDSVIASLRTANQELRDIIARSPRRLRVLSPNAEAAA